MLCWLDLERVVNQILTAWETAFTGLADDISGLMSWRVWNHKVNLLLLGCYGLIAAIFVGFAEVSLFEPAPGLGWNLRVLMAATSVATGILVISFTYLEERRIGRLRLDV